MRDVRDWLFLEDHVRALVLACDRGVPGATYNVGGQNERRNIDVVRQVCALVDELRPSSHGPRERLISFVTDRPGHDQRYAIDASRIRQDLDWRPLESFETGLRRTVAWYLAHAEWTERVLSGAYRLERLGAAVAS